MNKFIRFIEAHHLLISSLVIFGLLSGVSWTAHEVEGKLLKASATESSAHQEKQTEKPEKKIAKTAAPTRAEVVILVWKKLQQKACVKNLCKDMKGGRPEEIALCNLGRRDITPQEMASYDWYDQPAKRGEVVSFFKRAFNEKPKAELAPAKENAQLASRVWVTKLLKTATLKKAACK